MRLLLVLFGGGVALGLLELGVRSLDLRPPSHIIRLPGLHLLHGAPVWYQSTDREHRDCVERHPERTRILFLGSSITYGFQLSAEETFTTALESRLNELRPTPGFCVLNFAQPAFAFDQKLAVAQEEIPRYRPALVLWEDWLSEATRFVFLGDAAYAVQSLPLSPDGFFSFPGMPDVLNRQLFLHSRSYQYLTLTLGNRSDDDAEAFRAFVKQRLTQMPKVARYAGARLVIYVATSLARPFADPLHPQRAWQEPIFAMAKQMGIPAYSVAGELEGQDPAAIRLDVGCHFNAAGHRALVPVFERIVLEQLDAARAPS